MRGAGGASAFAFVLALFSLRVLAACSDYGTSDESAPADAGTGAGTSNVLTNGDFARGCAGWTAFGTTGTSDGVVAESEPTGHSGGPSCRVCRTSSFGGVLGIEQPVSRSIAVGEVVSGNVWVRGVPDAGALTKVQMFVSTRTTPDAVKDEVSSPAGDVTPTDEWKQASQVLTASGAAGAAVLIVKAESPSGKGCFLVDDAELTVTKK